MAKFFGQNQQVKNLSPRGLAEHKYNRSRSNLLVVLFLTLVNIVFLVLGGNRYWLFSARIPYDCVLFGMYACGKLPTEYYTDDPAEMASFIFEDTSYLIYMAIIAAVIFILFAVCYFCSSKNRYGWLIYATVLFALDTAHMFALYGIDASMILDIVFHVWVLVYLGIGIYNGVKLRRMPPDEIVFIPQADEAAAQTEVSQH